jgi:hypothetical protein
MFDYMPHHWRPSDHLERAPQPGLWLLVRRGIRLGSVEYGRVHGRQAFRGVTPGGAIVGYSWTLELACDRLWEWSVRTGRGAGMSAWPWPPIQIGEAEWVVMRNSPSQPKALVRLVPATEERPAHYRAVTWAPSSQQRLLIGYFPTLEAADEAVLEDSPGRIVVVPAQR